MSFLQKLIEPKRPIPPERQRYDDRALFRLTLPIIAEQLLAVLVGIADTLMVSYAGEAAVSGVSLVNQLCTVFIFVFSAMAAGGAVIASQYVGRGDRKNGRLAAGQLVMAVTVIAAVLTAFTLLFGRPVFLALFGSVEPAVYDAGMVYLRINAFSFIPLGLYNACAGLYRSMGRTRAVMNVSIVMNGINVVGNAVGVFGLHAGVAGVAWPTFISRTFAAAAMLCLLAGRENELRFRLRDALRPEWKMLRRIFHVAVPNALENGLFQLAKVALSAIVSTFGTVQIAANGVAQSFWSVAALFSSAMGPAYITVVGQYMGAGDVEGADYYMKKLTRITYLGGAVWNAAFFAVTPLLLRLYDLSGETVSLIILLCGLHNFFCTLFSPAAFALSSGLRAAGDIRFNLFAALFSTVVCRVAFSVILALWLQMGVIGITLAMAGDWAVKAALVAVRYKGGKWKRFKLI